MIEIHSTIKEDFHIRYHCQIFRFFKTLEIQSHKIIFIPIINVPKYSNYLVLFVYKKYDLPYHAITDWDYVFLSKGYIRVFFFLFLPFTHQYLILQNTDAFLYCSAVHVSTKVIYPKYSKHWPIYCGTHNWLCAQ